MALSSNPTNPKPVKETIVKEAIEYLIALLGKSPDPDKKTNFDNFTAAELIRHLEEPTLVGLQFVETYLRVEAEKAEKAEKGRTEELIQAIQSAIRHLNAPSDS